MRASCPRSLAAATRVRLALQASRFLPLLAVFMTKRHYNFLQAILVVVARAREIVA